MMAAGYKTYADALAAAQQIANKTGQPCLIKRTRSRTAKYAVGNGRYGVWHVRTVHPSPEEGAEHPYQQVKVKQEEEP